jgi:hypothetical protein
MFQAVEFVEERGATEPRETVLGEFESETEAVQAARSGKMAFLETGSQDFAWWVVRRQGAALAEFISDSKSDKEFVLDLNSGELVEIH